MLKSDSVPSSPYTVMENVYISFANNSFALKFDREAKRNILEIILIKQGPFNRGFLSEGRKGLTRKLLSSAEALCLEKLWKKPWKRTRKNTRREGSLCQMPHPRLALSGGRLFQFWACTRGIIMIKILSIPVLNVSGHSRPSLANIVKWKQNAEPCLGHYQGYHRSIIYCS